MSKTAIIYSFKAHKTSKAAEQIAAEFGANIEKVDAATITAKEFLKYDNLILGVPTWFDGELPNYWDEFVPAIEDMNLNKKRIALFGNGNQKDYPENFGDAVGLMAEILEAQGAQMVGFTPTDGYTYESSNAERNGQFIGLILDFENQHKLNDARIASWVKSLKMAFE